MLLRRAGPSRSAASEALCHRPAPPPPHLSQVGQRAVDPESRHTIDGGFGKHWVQYYANQLPAPKAAANFQRTWVAQQHEEAKRVAQLLSAADADGAEADALESQVPCGWSRAFVGVVRGGAGPAWYGVRGGAAGGWMR